MNDVDWRSSASERPSKGTIFDTAETEPIRRAKPLGPSVEGISETATWKIGYTFTQVVDTDRHMVY